MKTTDHQMIPCVAWLLGDLLLVQVPCLLQDEAKTLLVRLAASHQGGHRLIKDVASRCDAHQNSIEQPPVSIFITLKPIVPM